MADLKELAARIGKTQRWRDVTSDRQGMNMRDPEPHVGGHRWQVNAHMRQVGGWIERSIDYDYGPEDSGQQSLHYGRLISRSCSSTTGATFLQLPELPQINASIQ